jgi:hypothetical protein
MTIPEVRRLLIRFVLTKVPEPAHALSWSDWRRHHQLIAKHSHYKKRGHDPPKL